MPQRLRLLICGDRKWTDRWKIARHMNLLFDQYETKPEVVIHGAARGADEIGGLLAGAMGLEVMPFPADWNEYGRAAGPIRNQQMLDEGRPNFVLAFHENIKESKGTKDMLERAEKAGINSRLVS